MYILYNIIRIEKIKITSKEGFTLVELLAVIVILAIIAVIAVPSILGIIENSRKDSFKASLRSAIKVFETGLVTNIHKVNTEYNLNGIGENNPFKGRTIMYDSFSNKIWVNEARDNPTVTSSNYIITGETQKISSGLVTVGKPRDNNQNLLANKMIGGTITGTLGTNDSFDESTGYILGNSANNYVCLDINNDSDCDDVGEK